ncbi:hypothetical protein MBLNU13_g04894t2 [Cladosporium sp. NU13]
MWQTTPEDTDYEIGLDRVCKQFTVEYLAAVERHIERLLSFRRDEPRLANCFWEGHKRVRLEFSRKDSSTPAQSVHALTLPVSKRFRYSFPEHVPQKLDDLINAADWKSSKNRLKERILWIQYFKRQAVKA